MTDRRHRLRLPAAHGWSDYTSKMRLQTFAKHDTTEHAFLHAFEQQTFGSNFPGVAATSASAVGPLSLSYRQSRTVSRKRQNTRSETMKIASYACVYACGYKWACEYKVHVIRQKLVVGNTLVIQQLARKLVSLRDLVKFIKSVKRSQFILQDGQTEPRRHEHNCKSLLSCIKWPCTVPSAPYQWQYYVFTVAGNPSPYGAFGRNFNANQRKSRVKLADCWPTVSWSLPRGRISLPVRQFLLYTVNSPPSSALFV